jgi:hypothetical protein
MIGGTLEYLMTSLPNLSFQDTDEAKTALFTLLKKYTGNTSKESSAVEMFEMEAEKYLSKSSFQNLQNLNLNQIHKTEFLNHKSRVVSEFAKFTHALKNEIRVWLTTQNESDKKAAKNRVEEIFGEGSPLEKEIRIMKYQWDKLEELSIGHFADIEALFTYKLKLMILLRWWSFNKEKGFNKFIQMTTNN